MKTKFRQQIYKCILLSLLITTIILVLISALNVIFIKSDAVDMVNVSMENNTNENVYHDIIDGRAVSCYSEEIETRSIDGEKTCDAYSVSHGQGRENGGIDILSNGCRNYIGNGFKYGKVNIPYWINMDSFNLIANSTHRNTMLSDIEYQLSLWNQVVMHDDTGNVVNFYEVAHGGTKPDKIDGCKVIEILQDDLTAYGLAGVFKHSEYSVTLCYDQTKLRIGYNIDTVAHEFGHVLGLGDIDSKNGVADGTHKTLMSYSRGTTIFTLNNAIKYQDIQGVAVLNGVHTEHSYQRYVRDGSEYLHICFYCDRIDSRNYAIDDSRPMDDDTTCIHDYKQMISAGERHWLKCRKCYKVIESEYLVHGLTDTTLEITGSLNSTKSSLIIPDLIGGQSVVAIGENTFLNNDILSSVSLSPNIITIGNNAFKGCSSLTSVTIPVGTTYVGNGAFTGCNNLAITVSTGNLNYSAQGNVLYNKEKTTIIATGKTPSEITIDETITSIASHAFDGNSNVQTIKIKGAPKIGDAAFANCSNLLKLEIDSIIPPETGVGVCSGSFMAMLYVPYDVQEAYRLAFGTENVTSESSVIFFEGKNIYEAPKHVFFGQTIDFLITPKIAGYEFGGWYADGELYENGTVFMLKKSLTLTADMTAKTYEITLDANGGDIIGKDKIHVTYDELFDTETIARKEGYKLNGWKEKGATNYTLTADGKSFNTWDGLKDIKLYADWSIESYEIRISGEGMDILWLGDDMTFRNSQCLIKYNTPINAIDLVPAFKESEQSFRSGYIFTKFLHGGSTLGWAGIPDLGEDGEVVNIIPHWEKEIHTIYFNTQSEECSKQKIETEYNMPIDLTPPNRKGYTFLGWFENPNDETTRVTWVRMPDLSPKEQMNGHTQLFAKWQENDYIVVYSANGGSGNVMAGVNFRYTETKNLTPNTYYRTGHDFIGWSTASDGKVEFTDGQSINRLTDERNGYIVLYAVWQARTYSFICKNLAKGWTTSYVSFTYGVGTKELPEIYTSVTNGHVKLQNFYGWYTSPEFTTQVTSVPPWQDGDMILYAKYDYSYGFCYSFGTHKVTDGLLKNQPSFEVAVDLGYVKYDHIKDTTLKRIKIVFSLELWEVNDGYQEFFLLPEGTKIEKKSAIWQQTIEHGVGKKDTTPARYSFEIYLDLETYKTTDYFTLCFGASGALEDTWNFDDFEMFVYFVN